MQLDHIVRGWRELTLLSLFMGATVASFPIVARAQTAEKLDTKQEYPNFNHGDENPKDPDIEWVQAIKVSAPAIGSDVKGNVVVTFSAPDMKHAKASCWQQPTKAQPSPWGHDVDVAPDIKLDAQGNGTFVFPAEQFPNGPLTLRIYAKDDGHKQDQFQLQLYNLGGVKWDQGSPKAPPPAAKDMKLVFEDDFNALPTISHDGKGARYQSHKTGGGDFSGWPFSNFEDKDVNPFSQKGTFLRIHASKKPDGKSSTGILSSAREDKDNPGFFAGAPCYFECRFIAQSAPGTWPAFWLLNKGSIDKTTQGADELDIIEAYGGLGKGNPNFPGYAVTSHYWDQKGPDGKPKTDDHKDADIMNMGSKSTWSTTFHTYAIKITPTDTIYYFDDIEFFRHPTNKISKTDPFWFLINYAIGGISGWPTDLERYGNSSDMWVDYVRVYQGERTG